MTNFVDGPEIPIGFGMALAQDLEAMDYFATLSMDQQRALIENARRMDSKEEMRSFVRSLRP